jgi:sirohydrochlorin ferrochelatase
MPEQPAILLIAHGSRHEEANADTRHFAEELVRQGAYRIAVAAFLELAEPDIDGGAASCVELGATSVVLLPHFLSPGVHVRRDLGEALQRLSERFPAVEFLLAEPLGRHPLLLQIFAERARGATKESGGKAPHSK